MGTSRESSCGKWCRIMGLDSRWRTSEVSSFLINPYHHYINKELLIQLINSVEERWTGLSNALAGLFCASLSSLPQSRTTSPLYAFSPEGQLPLYPSDSPLDSSSPPVQSAQNDTAGLPYRLYHAILPSENICTENLTPFIKLLPCKNYAGIAELLNPHKLFGGWWYGVGVHATWHDGSRYETEGIEIPVTHDAMAAMGKKARHGKFEGDSKVITAQDKDAPAKRSHLDPLTQKQSEKPGIRLRLTVGAVMGAGSHAKRTGGEEAKWSLESMFGKNITGLCAVTKQADIRILATDPEKELSGEEAKDADPEWKLVSDPLPDGTRRVDRVWKSKRTRISGHTRPYLAVGEEKWNIIKVRDKGLNLTITEQNLHQREFRGLFFSPSD